MSEEAPAKSYMTAALIGLLLVFASVGGSLIYLINTDNVPAWLSFIYGKSSYSAKQTNEDRVLPPQKAASFAQPAPAPEATAESPSEKGTGDREAPAADTTEATPSTPPAADTGDETARKETAEPETPERAADLPDTATETPEAPAAENAAALGPDALHGQEGAPGAPADDGDAAAPAGSEKEKRPTAAQQQEDDVILYGKAKPVGPSRSKVAGEIPLGQRAIPAPRLGRAPDVPPGSAKSLKGQDGLVTVILIDDFAKLLADNYWPVGTHPMAKSRGISTAGAKWANMRFGGQMHGFAINAFNLPQERQRVLEYMYVPSMVEGLYALYRDRFFYALEQHAQAQTRGEAGFPLDGQQLAEMYGIYAKMARGMAGTVRSYRQNPGIRPLVTAYLEAEEKTTAAYRHFVASQQKTYKGTAGFDYQNAVRQREQHRARLAGALKAGGQSDGVDEDSMVYTAMWLYRRGDGKDKAARSLERVLRDCATRLESLQKHYQQSEAPR